MFAYPVITIMRVPVLAPALLLREPRRRRVEAAPHAAEFVERPSGTRAFPHDLPFLVPLAPCKRARIAPSSWNARDPGDRMQGPWLTAVRRRGGGWSGDAVVS
jgi:hypothetical protein